MTWMTVRQVLDQARAELRAGRVAGAESLYRQVLQSAPGHPEALHQLGTIAFRQRRFGDAAEWLRRCAAAVPHELPVRTQWGLALAAAGRHEEAAEVQRDVIARTGTAPPAGAYGNLGTSLLRLERMGEAVDAFRKEVSFHPNDARAWDNLALTLAEVGRIPEAVEACRRGLAAEPGNAQMHSNLLMLMHFDPAADRNAIRAEHEAWAGRHAAPLATEVRPHRNDRTPDRRLRVGYVSPDFRRHVVGWSILPVILNHDPAAVEVFCYSGTTAPDDVTQQLRGRADVWRDTLGQTEAQFAEQVRQDRIDILVDLTLHMGQSALLAFARKPAPVQVTYVGYAATTGLPAMDYRITDVHMDPPGEPSDGPEELLRLPECYWAYRPPIEAQTAAVWPPPVLRNGYVTFASFNNFRKVNPGVIAAWARLMRELPDAKLLIVLRGGETNTHVGESFEQHGVARDRIRLVGRVPVDQYFRLHNEVDVSLDPFPYNGGITSLNSLWMGVPFVTLVGDRAVARAGLSILTNVGLPELAVRSEDEYVQALVALARDRGRLAALRSTLRDRLRQSLLMDEVRFARDVERCYREAWARWCAAPHP